MEDGNITQDYSGGKRSARRRPHLLFVVTASCSLGFLNGQLKYLRSQGFEVSVISSSGPEQETVRKEGASVFSVPMEREISVGKDVFALWRLWRIMRRTHPDVTIVGTPKAGLLGGLASVLAGVPRRIYILHGLRLETSGGWKRRLLFSCERLACCCAHIVRCVSPSLMNRVIQLDIVAGDKCMVVGQGTSNGIDLEHWRRSPESEVIAQQTREWLGISPQALVVGFVGRFTRDKGIVELYEAFTQLQASYSNLRLLIVGEFEKGDPVPPGIRARIECDPAVVRTGFAADVAPYLWTMDVLALPTYREGFPGVPLEAQAASIPVITTDATGAIDAILDGVTGIHISIGDIGALSAALNRLLADPELRTRMGHAGCAWVEQNFKRETVWKFLLVNYRSLLLHAAYRPQSGLSALLKRGVDSLVAALLLILSAPLWPAVAIAIRLSLGAPLLFRQVRPGYHGTPFTLFKFRTMRDARKTDGTLLPDADRITRIGSLLRSMSIDELPQLVNVLRGEMSLVGPRPLLMEYLDRYTPEQVRRHEVLPGITGWAQINGRNAISWEQRFSMDTWYIDHWSLWLDMKILCGTVLRVLRREGISNQDCATMPEFMGLGGASDIRNEQR
jgi:lipopolysaccharide/colanic/teichoic acid biosynthesis glycosyltransferase